MGWEHSQPVGFPFSSTTTCCSRMPSARPGGSQRLFLAEVEEAEEEHHVQLTVQAFREIQEGRLPAGRTASGRGFARRLQEVQDAGAVVDPRAAQIEGLTKENTELRERIARRDGELAKVTEFRLLAISWMAARHDEIERLRSRQVQEAEARVTHLASRAGEAPFGPGSRRGRAACAWDRTRNRPRPQAPFGSVGRLFSLNPRGSIALILGDGPWVHGQLTGGFGCEPSTRGNFRSARRSSRALLRASELAGANHVVRMRSLLPFGVSWSAASWCRERVSSLRERPTPGRGRERSCPRRRRRCRGRWPTT